MLQNPSHRPPLARLLDLGDRMRRAVGIQRNPLSPEAIKREAAAAMKLDDFGPPDFEEGLALYCRSAEEEGRLDIVGREIVRRAVRRILSNRLLLIEHRKSNPELPELIPPLIVMGLPRTGTTLMHRLLAQDPQAFGPPAWLVWRPLPRLAGADRRREITIRAIEGMRQLSPQLDFKHYQEADEPEECYHLLDPSFRTPTLAMICQATSYFQWAREQDLQPAYRMYHEYLRIIQKEAPGRRLTLKAPLHTPYLEEILAELPGVRFVQTHRDPLEVAGSFASLCYSTFAMTSTRVEARECGEVALQVLRWMAARNLE
ncbi:MAG: sulfotransferase, partial [Thermoanaerobaculia bacterium]